MQPEISENLPVQASGLFVSTNPIFLLQGLAIFTVSKVGAMASIRLGSGILVARLEDGTWSAPSAMALAGVGGGGQFGFELSDFVFILYDERAVRAFSRSGTLTIGANASLAFGPIGRILEGGGAAGMKGVGGIFAWSTTRGLFGGASLEGSVMVERCGANRKMYGGEVTAQQLLAGHMQPPTAAEPLMQILNSDIFSSESSQEPPADPSPEQSENHSEPPQEISQEPPCLPPLDLNSETNHELPSEPPAAPAPEHPTGPPPQPPYPLVGSQNASPNTPGKAPETRARFYNHLRGIPGSA